MTRPLFARFPALRTVLSCVEFATLPTPVQRLGDDDLAWIKRDDLTYDVYGGNKIRKLEFILGEWRERNIREVITIGAIGTNAGLATALLCHREKIACRVLLFDQPMSETALANLRAMQQLGARLDYCGSLAQALWRYYTHPLRLLPSRYFLFAGCSNPAATFGYVDAAFELQAQIAQGAMPVPELIVVAVGSGSTLAGLTLGCQLAGLNCRVIGVRVTDAQLGPIAACTEATVMKQIITAYRLIQRCVGGPLPPPSPPILRNEYFGKGYGIATTAGSAAIDEFRDRFDLPLEQTYSGKAAACFLDCLKSARRPVLFWNTFNSRPLTGLPCAAPQYELPAALQARIAVKTGIS